ncbi:glycine cleavage system protein GcvH [Microaceticoccus formicicus]|uniref:glycine cleavage system protein GcvH n=1 Tax=Microaceticoccus formicicus TaxID=3118105 RepID=UPI003CD0242C|nr:glycine cleavage system protein GcvH [Peptoniphilaceae bacterium AMB_02]
MKVEKGLFYTKDHEWVKIDGNEVVIGISDYAQDHLGDIVYVELPDVDDELDAGEAVASIESVKAASDAFTPFAGKVLEVNEDLDDDPALINSDAYGAWLVKLEVEDAPTDDLMNDEEYEKFLAEEA